jgi:hypothetical protein
MSQATNSLGVEVQAYNAQTGWVAVSGPFADPEQAHIEMRKLGLLGGGCFRVYEALNHPSNNKD